MVREEITPACIAFENELAGTRQCQEGSRRIRRHGGRSAGQGFPELTEELYTKSAALDEAVAAVPTDDNESGTLLPRCCHLRMDEVRAPADKLEGLVGKKFWPFPTYSDILFYV